MKRYRLIQTACLAALAVGFASCSQDELLTSAEGPGTAVTFTATGLAMPQVETRATTDDTWEDGLTVGIKIGDEVKEYAATPNATNPNMATLAAAEGEAPFYWASATETKTVSAWYPYTDGQTTMPNVIVEQDQSIEANYLASDLLSATQEVSYGDTDLHFAHLTAKITLNFTVPQGGNISMKDAEVVLSNLSTANGNPASIRCFDASAEGSYTYYALISPQTFAAGNALFYVRFTNDTHSYSPDAAIEFKAGYEYVFDVKVSDMRLIVTPPSEIAWESGNSAMGIYQKTDLGNGDYVLTTGGVTTYYVGTEAGLRAWAEYTNQGNWRTYLTLMNNITMTKPEDGLSNWTPIGRRESSTGYDTYTGTIEGNGHTIDNMVVDDPNEYYATMVVALGVGG